MKLKDDEVAELQRRYSDVINYQSVDPMSPIDPLNYADSNRDNLLHIAAMRGCFCCRITVESRIRRQPHWGYGEHRSQLRLAAGTQGYRAPLDGPRCIR